MCCVTSQKLDEWKANEKTKENTGEGRDLERRKH